MAISNLQSLTSDQYRALSISSFQFPPKLTTSGSPDQNVSVGLAGWVGTDTIAFTVTTAANNTSGLNVDGSVVNMIDLNVNTGTSSSLVTYWTINMGANAKGTDWSLSFDVSANNRSTGKWTFVKGKMTNDDDFIPKP
jgi:hypothetical protein